MFKISRGFTILELAISLALITLVSVIAIPAYYAQPSITLDNAAELLARDLRYTQNEAAVRATDTQVVFDESGDGYIVETVNAAPLPNPVGGGDLFRIYSRDAIFEGVLITSVKGPDIRMVRFDRNGFCMDRASIELHYEEEVRVVNIAKGSGLIEIEGMTSGWEDDGL